jgi:hypothetical protein
MGTISKLSGRDIANVEKIDDVAKSNIAKFSGQEIPSTSSAAITSGAWYDIRPWDTNSDSGSGSTVTNLGSLGGTTNLYNGVLRTTKGGADCWFTDGVNDYMQQPASSTQVSGYGYPYTMEGWFYREARPSSGQFRPHMVMSISDHNHERSRISITSVASGTHYNRIAFSQHYGNATRQSNVYSVEGFSEWFHLCVVFRSNAMVLYIDGSLVQTNSLSMGANIFSKVNSGNDLKIEVGQWTRATFGDDEQRGYHGDFRVYTSELSASEVQNNFDVTKSYYGK